jgi:hypothetical protein
MSFRPFGVKGKQARFTDISQAVFFGSSDERAARNAFGRP